jgi:hypothetical protein
VATFYVDRDGRGGVVGSDTTWTVAQRAGDATKPFATLGSAIQQVTAANAAGGDTIRVRTEISSAPYPAWTASGQQPTAKNTIVAHDLAGEGRPSFTAGTFTSPKNWRMEGLRYYGFLTISDGRFLELVNNQGRTRDPASAVTGAFFVKGLNNSLLERNDFQYTGPNVSTLNGPVVPLNFTGDVATQSSNIIRRNRCDGYPGDFINGPGATTMADWTIESNEFGRAFTGALANGSTLHTDVIQWETGPNVMTNLVITGNIIYGAGGTGRVLLMAQQGSGGVATGLGSFSGLQVLDNAWYDNDDFSLRIFSAPGVVIAGNTVWPGSTAATHGIDLHTTQNPSASDVSTYTTNVRMKGNIIRGIVVQAGVTFTSDTGYNLFPSAAARSGYTKTATDLADGSPTFVSTSYNAAGAIRPDLHLAPGSRGLDEGPLLTDTPGMAGIPATDAEGSSRAGTRMDVGAYETGGTVGPPPPAPGATGSTDALLPTGAVNDKTLRDGLAWTAPANVIEQVSANWATVSLNGSVFTGWAQALRTSFSMGLASDQQAQGLTVTFNRHQSSSLGTIQDTTVRIYANGALQGVNRALSGAWPISAATVTYGSATDLWGASNVAQLDAWVRAPDFGIVFVVTNPAFQNSVARADWAKAQVAWATPSVPVAAPTPSLAISPNPATAGATVTFNASGSSGSIDTYELSFNGGLTFSPASGAVSTQTFAAGSYDVQLRVRGPGGSNTSATQTLVINEVVVAPRVTGALSPDTGAKVGDTIVMTWSTTGTVTKTELSWGDVTTFADVTGQTSGTHVYTDPGSYTVRVRVTGPGGTFTFSQTHTIGAIPPPAEGVPVPALTLLPSTATVGQPVLADFAGTAGTVTKYEISWSGATFVDLGLATSATHVYDTAGSYTVTLRVSNVTGAAFTAKILTVQAPVVEVPPVDVPPVDVPPVEPDIPHATPDLGRTFAELQAEVLEHGFSAQRYQGRIRTWLNEGLGQIARRSAGNGFERTVTLSTREGVAAYEIPGAVVRVISVSDGRYQLRNVPVEDVDDRIGNVGAPTDYTVFGAGLILSPTPRSARDISVRYRSRPTLMVTDTDRPGLPSAYEDLILSYALWHAFRSEDDTDMAAFYKAEWSEGLAQLRTDLQYPDESIRRQVPGMLANSEIPRFIRPE